MPDVDRLRLETFEPAYLRLGRGEIADRAEAARRELACCRACPRDCGVDRLGDGAGFCGIGRRAVVASAFPHHGEESCLSGTRGSGTVFFSMCNLRCVFCQNWTLSQRREGALVAAEDLAQVFLLLQDEGCHNLNLVTPEHVVPQVIEALALAVPRGLRLPIVYNTSGYDALGSLRLLDGLVDIYMPDFKFWRAETAARLCKARDYPERTRQAIREMHRQVGPLRLDGDGLARRGVLVRHLVMPGLVDESTAILAWLASELGPDTFVNVMAQYHPDHEVVWKRRGDGRLRYADIGRRPEPAEMEAARAAARSAGLRRLAC